MNPESLMHERGSVAVVAHKNQFTREEKDALRDSDLVKAVGDHYVLLIQEEIEENDALALAAFEEFEDDQREEATGGIVTVDLGSPEFAGKVITDAIRSSVKRQQQSDEPTMEDLRALTVEKLKELADKEQVDLTGLKLKDDILGRMAAHFGLDPAS